MAQLKEFRDTMWFEYSPESFKEDKNGGRFVVRGRFQFSDKKNGNGRVYERKIWEKVLAHNEVQEKLKAKGMLGELEHPNDGVTNLSRVSHVVLDLKLESNGELIGQAEVLETPSGLIARELFRKGCRVGISSRGKGTSRMEGGIEYVNDDFVLETFDFVENPSTPGAHPTVVSESKDPNKLTETHMDPKELITTITNRCKDIRSLLPTATEADRARFSEEILSHQMQLSTALNENKSMALPSQDLAEDLKALRKEIKEAGMISAPAKSLGVSKSAGSTSTTMPKPPRLPKMSGGGEEDKNLGSGATKVVIKTQGKNADQVSKDIESSANCRVSSSTTDADGNRVLTFRCFNKQQADIVRSKAQKYGATVDEGAMYDDDDQDQDAATDDSSADAGQDNSDDGSQADSGKSVGPDGPDTDDEVDLEKFLQGDLDKLSKESLKKKLVKALSLGEGLLRRNKKLANANRVLSEGQEHAMGLLAKMTEQKKALAAREYVVEQLERNPDLIKHRAKLLSEKTIEGAEKAIREARTTVNKAKPVTKPTTGNAGNRSELPFGGKPGKSNAVTEGVNKAQTKVDEEPSMITPSLSEAMKRRGLK